MSVEVLSGVENRSYYLDKIAAIKQDIRDKELGIKSLYQDKSELIKGWAICLEELHEIPTEEIARTIVNELIRLDCKKGVRTAYRHLDKKYKRNYKQDLTGVGDEEEEEHVSLDTFDTSQFIDLPNEIISLETAPPEDIQANEEALSKLVKEVKRRWQEYIDTMRRRRISRIGQKEADVEGTPQPYDPVKGHFFNAAIRYADLLQEESDTWRDISDKIEYYPPGSESEDKELAEGVEAWAILAEWRNEHVRPYADLKFSQSYVDWFDTEALNRDFGKHAAAVKSKVQTITGGFRGLTREQVGDKIPDLAEKAVHMKGMFDIANKAFGLFQKNMPKWRKERLDPSVGTRKEKVGPKLSESAFGSDKDR